MPPWVTVGADPCPEATAGFPVGAPCNDCGVDVGEWHHVGCDRATCAVSGDQALDCDCWNCERVVALVEGQR
jgi:hypothetical protein